jgi:hypothetical protein
MDNTELEFEGLSFTDDSLRALPDLDQAEMLVLRGTAVTDVGCRELLRARALLEVSIISEMITDEVFQVLAQLPALRSLQVHHGPRVGDNGLRYLSGCVGLRELYLKQTAITDRGLMAIRRLPQVWSLILDDTSISDDGCAALGEMAKLSLLSLNRTQVTGHGLSNLCDDDHFSVYLEGTPATDEGMVAMAQRLSKLQTISVIQTTVGDGAARAFSTLQWLNDVRFSYTKLTDQGLGAFTRHPFLDVIYVEGCEVTIAAVQALIKASPRDLTVYGPEPRRAHCRDDRAVLKVSISPEFLPSELHYIIPLAEQHGTEARVAQYDHALGRHVQYGERLSDEEIEPLRKLYMEISSRQDGPLINSWHQSSKGTCPPETTWPVYGLLCLFRQLGDLGIAPFNDGVIRPHA